MAKAYLFSTKLYTKTDWHTGKLIVAKSPMGNEGLDDGSAGQIAVKRDLARVASSPKIWNNPRARAHVTVNGVKMIVGNLIIGKALAGKTHGGRENREATRQIRHERTLAKLSGNIEQNFRSTMTDEYPED
jgi:hypothetical protein